MTDLDAVERCLEVGRPAVLHIRSRRGAEISSRMIIRGWQRGSYILLDLPGDSGLDIGPRPGDACALRFLADGDACRLDSTLLDLGSGRHFSYVRIAWPEKIFLTRVRRHQRVHVQIPCTVRLKDGESFDGEIQDISEGGCRVRLDRPFSERTTIELRFRLARETENVVTAEVCAINPFPGGGWLGCKFVDLSPELRYDIEFYVASIAARSRLDTSPRSGVLIISPNPEEVSPLKQALVALNQSVTVSPTLVDGFFWLRAASPAVVLLSANPKPFAVLDVIGAIRESRAAHSVPIVVFGGSATGQNAAREAGAANYFAAGAQVQEIVTAVQSLLAQVQPPQPDEECPASN